MGATHGQFFAPRTATARRHGHNCQSVPARTKRPASCHRQLTNGSVRPGAPSARPGSMGTDVSYDQNLGAAGKLLMAGEFDYDQTLPGAALGGSVATLWLPGGQFGVGPKPPSSSIKSAWATRADRSAPCASRIPSKSALATMSLWNMAANISPEAWWATRCRPCGRTPA